MKKIDTITSCYQLINCLVLVSACFFTACETEKKLPFDMTEVVEEGNRGYLFGELIYPLDNKPTPECHASTLEETSSGIIAAWFGGTHEKHEDVGIWVAHRNNGKWSRPVEVANGIQSDTLRYPCWNPVLFQPKEGPLLLFYKVGPSPIEWWGMLITSEDEGKTWSEPQKLGKASIGHLLGPVKNKPIQMADGSILCPSSSERKVDGDVFWKVHFEKTKDLGKTWEVIGPINNGVTFDAIQPSILTYPNGKMQILCRSRENVIAQSWSEDGGNTWSEVNGTSLPNPSAGTDAITLKDGRQLLVYNHTIREQEFPSSRNMLNIALSTDGIDWRPVMTLEREEGEFSYPAVIQANDEIIHISYTYQRKSIKYVQINPKELK